MPKTQSLTKKKSIMDMLSGKQILIPIAALLLLAVFNLIADPSFYKITLEFRKSCIIRISDYNPGLWLGTCHPRNRNDTCYSGFRWTGYLRWSRHCNRRFRYLTRAVRKQFTSGSVTGTDYRGISGKLCRCDAFWSIQRNIGGGI